MKAETIEETIIRLTIADAKGNKTLILALIEAHFRNKIPLKP